MHIYVASSWRNAIQPEIVARLRALGHEVYDFRHPKKGDDGFNWREIDPDWEAWSAAAYRDALAHPVAIKGFMNDKIALDWCDVCVLVMPCGRSAHLELGYAAGAGKRTAVLLNSSTPTEPELMVKLADTVCVTFMELQQWLKEIDDGNEEKEHKGR